MLVDGVKTMLVLNFIVVAVVLVIVQTTLCMPSPMWLAAPDFYFVLVAYLAFRLELLPSLLILFPMACVLDVLSGTILGMYPLLCFGGYFLLRHIAGRMPVNEVLYQTPLIGASYLFGSWVVHYLLEFLQRGQQTDWVWWQMLFRALLVAICCYPLFALFEAVRRYSQGNMVPWNRLRLRRDNRRRRA